MKIVTDLDKFSLEQIWWPFQTMKGFEERLEKAPLSLEATAAALREETEWSKCVLDRLKAIGIKFPPYIVHPLVDVVTGRAVEKCAPPSDMTEWRASSSIDGPSESGYYSAGIDLPMKDWRGRTDWHEHVIQVHRKDQAEAVSIRDAILTARHVAVGEHLNERSSEKATDPGSESRAERLMHAMEGELDGHICDVEAAMCILAHVDAGGYGAAALAPALATLVEAGKRLSAQPDRMKDLRAFVEYWGLDCYTESADIRRQVRDVVMAFLILAKETARQVMEAAPAGVTLKPLEWVPAHEEGCRLFHADAVGFRISYGTDRDGIAWALSPGSLIGEYGSEDEAKSAAERFYHDEAYARAEELGFVFGPASPSYEDGVKEGLRRALRAACGCEITLPLAVGIPDGAAMASRQIEAAILSLLTKEEGNEH